MEALQKTVVWQFLIGKHICTVALDSVFSMLIIARIVVCLFVFFGK